ncbi:MAG: hypothetical protein A4E71_01827 [Smithella sp. PtaU1.Bin162]|nr:MAG: hypothetical protein A4E71_01827 [Smithella sp. PtaU1.Bin162]
MAYKPGLLIKVPGFFIFRGCNSRDIALQIILIKDDLWGNRKTVDAEGLKKQPLLRGEE